MQHKQPKAQQPKKGGKERMRQIFEYLLRILLPNTSLDAFVEWNFQVRYEKVDEVLAWKICRNLKRKVKGGLKLQVMPLQEKTATDVIGVLMGTDGTRQVCREVWRTQELSDGRKKLLIEKIQA